MNKDVRPSLYPFDQVKSEHIPLEKLVELLLSGTPLNNAEHAHLMRCSTCANAMMQAASARLQGPGDAIN